MRFWLMKAEPDSRIVKGNDVKFSVDDFEEAKTTAWEGVRNHEAKNLMKEMEIGDKVLFYHSNCKNPGIAGFAEVSARAYTCQDSAWNAAHPYFDPKTKQENPTWYMVDLTFVKRAPHFVPLALLRTIAALSTGADPPEGLEYIGKSGIIAHQGMALVNRGRLSVQRVEETTFDVISSMTERGGWDDKELSKKAQKKTSTKASKKGETEDKPHEGGPEAGAVSLQKGKKRKAATEAASVGARRSTRIKR
ncbi:DUF55-domain-containing protein [Punctularia strigosozonata HHB-11173 SS5]|uniref:DUF55-domain-containing protein n=1 Tax=Punctularia strigosozonata (strain HHB-11173) TaxID=741275 RepID=UPI0004416755|nr:DUF55-domain-containing protein [Punctularia strigosozonata HHB-11173 SS5]EIN10939.1 DUF55-domain-containing protein [Punctularia strigosozonata HHB-11173 SS5]